MPTRRAHSSHRWLWPLFLAAAPVLLAADDPAKTDKPETARPGFAAPKVEPAAVNPAPPAEAGAQITPPLDAAAADSDDKPPKKRPEEKPPTATTRDFFGRGTTTYTLTLNEAIRSALANNLDARIEEAGISLEDARVRNAYGEFDPIFSVSASRSWTQNPDSRNNISSADSVAQIQAIQAQVDAINANTRANQAFTNAVLQALGRPPQQFDTTPLTTDFASNERIIFDQDVDRGEVSIQARTPIGTILRASARMQKLRSTFDGDTRPIFPTYLAGTTLEFRQPLLKDFGFAANLADLRIARKNREAQRYNWQFRLEATLQNVVATYYDMQFGLNDLKNKGDAIMAGLKLVAHSQRRQELGFFSPYEVKQAQVQLSIDRENLLITKTLFLERQFGMKRLVLGSFESDDRRVFLPNNIPTLKLPTLQRDALLAIAFDRRLDYKAAILAAEAEDVRLKFARNQLWPQLDVVGTYGWAGLDSSYPSAYGQMMEGQAPSWSFGATLSFPLGGIQPRAQLDAAKSRQAQAILRVKASELEVGLAVENAIELIQTNQERLSTARLTTKVADDAVRIGFRRMEEGLISNFDLIEQQRRLYEARTRELGAVSELNRSITQLWLATGTVLENLNIAVPEPQPVGKKAGPPKAVVKNPAPPKVTRKKD